MMNVILLPHSQNTGLSILSMFLGCECKNCQRQFHRIIDCLIKTRYYLSHYFWQPSAINIFRAFSLFSQADERKHATICSCKKMCSSFSVHFLSNLSSRHFIIHMIHSCSFPQRHDPGLLQLMFHLESYMKIIILLFWSLIRFLLLINFFFSYIHVHDPLSDSAFNFKILPRSCCCRKDEVIICILPQVPWRYVKMCNVSCSAESLSLSKQFLNFNLFLFTDFIRVLTTIWLTPP